MDLSAGKKTWRLSDCRSNVTDVELKEERADVEDGEMRFEEDGLFRREVLQRVEG